MVLSLVLTHLRSGDRCCWPRKSTRSGESGDDRASSSFKFKSMSKVRLFKIQWMPSGGEFDTDAAAVGMDYLEATGKYLQGRSTRLSLEYQGFS